MSDFEAGVLRPDVDSVAAEALPSAPSLMDCEEDGGEILHSPPFMASPTEGVSVQGVSGPGDTPSDQPPPSPGPMDSAAQDVPAAAGAVPSDLPAPLGAGECDPPTSAPVQPVCHGADVVTAREVDSHGNELPLFLAGVIGQTVQRPPPRDIVNSNQARWTMEKVFNLNNSRTKSLIVGIDLSQNFIKVYAFFRASDVGDLGVGLEADEIRSLFEPDWLRTVLRHMSTRQCSGVSKRHGRAKFELTTLRSSEPALRVEVKSAANGRTSFVTMGEVTVRVLYDMAPAISFYLNRLDYLVSGPIQDWLAETVSDVVQVLRHPKDLPDQSMAEYLVAEEGVRVCKGTRTVYLDNRVDFVIDMCFRHRCWFAKMIYDACHRKDDSE